MYEFNLDSKKFVTHTCHMFSKILIKLIDQAIVPAILLLVTRIVSVLLLSNYFNVPYEISNTGFVFSDATGYVKVNSFSLIMMLTVIAAGIFYVLLKSYIFHDTHIQPKLTAKLFSLRLSSFIQTSFDIYSQGAVWLSYVYLLFLVSIFMSFFGLAYTWVFFVAFIIAVVSTVAFVFDIEQELYMDVDDSTEEILELDEYMLSFEIGEE